MNRLRTEKQIAVLSALVEGKFVPTWTIGKRNGETAFIFIRQIKNTLNGNRPQISTDAFLLLGQLKFY